MALDALIKSLTPGIGNPEETTGKPPHLSGGGT